MAETNSTVADLISQFHHLRVEATAPFCWLIKMPSPLSSKQCEAERKSFLVKLMTCYCTATWCTDALKSGAAEVSWVTTKEAVPHIVGENSYLGDWVLLLFAGEVRYTSESPRGIGHELKNCHDAFKMLEVTGADLLLHSMPDDNEWLITQRR